MTYSNKPPFVAEEYRGSFILKGAVHLSSLETGLENSLTRALWKSTNIVLVSGHGLGAPGDLTGLRVNANEFAFLDKERDAHDEARFQRRLLGGAAGRGVAAQAQLG